MIGIASLILQKKCPFTVHQFTQVLETGSHNKEEILKTRISDGAKKIFESS